MKNKANSETIHIFFNEQYPFGYAISNNRNEASKITQELVNRTGKSWSVMAGGNHWKTGKPAYYTIWTDEPNKNE